MCALFSYLYLDSFFIVRFINTFIFCNLFKANEYITLNIYSLAILVHCRVHLTAGITAALAYRFYTSQRCMGYSEIKIVQTLHLSNFFWELNTELQLFEIIANQNNVWYLVATNIEIVRTNLQNVNKEFAYVIRSL